MRKTVTRNTTFCFKNPETQLQPRAICNSTFFKLSQITKLGKDDVSRLTVQN